MHSLKFIRSPENLTTLSNPESGEKAFDEIVSESIDNDISFLQHTVIHIHLVIVRFEIRYFAVDHCRLERSQSIQNLKIVLEQNYDGGRSKIDWRLPHFLILFQDSLDR